MKKLLIAALLVSSCAFGPVYADIAVKDAAGVTRNACSTLVSTTETTCVQLKNTSNATIDPATAQNQANANSSLATIVTNTAAAATAANQASANALLSTIVTNTGAPHPDALTSGSIASGTANAVYNVTLGNSAGTVAFAVSGLTASAATLTIEGTADGTTWTTVHSVSAGSGALFNTLTTDGQYRVPAAGRRGIRLRVSTTGTGSISVASNVSTTAHEMAVDPNNAAYQGEIPMTVGTAYATARSLKAVCTAVGNVSVTYADGSTGTWAISATGVSVLPIAVTTVNTAGTTATCTYSNLK